MNKKNTLNINNLKITVDPKGWVAPDEGNLTLLVQYPSGYEEPQKTFGEVFIFEKKDRHGKPTGKIVTNVKFRDPVKQIKFVR